MILGITPARSGSKGIPDKNIIEVGGKPLIAHTIAVALAVPELDRYIISTDSKKIATLCQSLGAEVPFLRPPPLASDTAAMLPVLEHALVEMENMQQEKVDFIVLLDPTAPLRKIEDVRNAIGQFIESDCDVLISVHESERNPYFNMVEVRNGFCKTVVSGDTPINRRQDAPEVFDMNTVVAIFSRKAIVDIGERLPPKTKPFFVPRERSIDIDTPTDLKFVDFLLSTKG